MKNSAPELTCEVELQPGEKMTLPLSFVERIGPGRWRVTVEPLPQNAPIRTHGAFLNAYIPEDEGLYDDYPSR